MADDPVVERTDPVVAMVVMSVWWCSSSFLILAAGLARTCRDENIVVDLSAHVGSAADHQQRSPASAHHSELWVAAVR